jgi:hypothetical protein
MRYHAYLQWVRMASRNFSRTALEEFPLVERFGWIVLNKELLGHVVVEKGRIDECLFAALLAREHVDLCVE